MMVLLKSTPKSIMAEVAINLFLSSLNAARVIPLMAPPVPNKPALNPEKVPPIMAFHEVGNIFKRLKNKNTKLKTIRKAPRK